MFTNHIKSFKLNSEHFLILFLLFVINNFYSANPISSLLVNSQDSVFYPVVGFCPDTVNSVKSSIRNEPASFLVNNNKGQEWTILAPPQFGFHDLQIKATPLVDIQIDSTFGAAVAGLKLEPSEILFSNPIKINLTLDDTYHGLSVVFFLTDDFGNMIEIPNQQHEKNDYTIEINHFSGLVGVVPASIENICMISKFSTSVNVSNAKSLFTDNPRISVMPVSSERRCDEEDDQRLLSLNVAQMMEPERSAITNILSSHRGMALSCTIPDLSKFNLPEEVYKLSNQLVKKALNAIAEYKNQPEKLAAIGMFAMIACRENGLIGSPNAEEKNKQVFEALNSWTKSNIKYYKNKIAEEHDFRYITTLFDSYIRLNTLACDENASLNAIEELEKLLRFDLEIEAHVYRDCNGGDFTSSEYTITKGTVKLATDLSSYAVSENYPYTLIGTGKFSSKGKAIRKGQGATDVSTVISDMFEKEYTVNLNFCEQVGETRCISPGNKKEEWEGDEFINHSLRQMRFTNTYFNMLNRYHKNEGRYKFTIQNRQLVLIDDVNTVIQAYDNGEQKVKTDFYYKLIHKPQQ